MERLFVMLSGCLPGGPFLSLTTDVDGIIQLLFALFSVCVLISMVFTQHFETSFSFDVWLVDGSEKVFVSFLSPCYAFIGLEYGLPT